VPRSITGTQPRRRFLGVAALLASPAAALALMAGCSVGQVSQTDTMVPAVPGTSLDVNSGQVDASLRNLMIAYNSPQGYSAGSTAPLVVFMTNNSADEPIVLTSVTATDGQGGPSLGTVVLTGGPVTAQKNPAPGASGSAGPSASASASASAAPSTSASASAPSSTAPSGAPSAPPSGGPSAPAGSPINLTIPPASYVQLAQQLGAHLAITGLTRPLTPGAKAYLTFTFAGAPPAGTPVPFEVPLSAPPRVVPSNADEE
jgi:hypothetical protein